MKLSTAPDWATVTNKLSMNCRLQCVVETQQPDWTHTDTQIQTHIDTDTHRQSSVCLKHSIYQKMIHCINNLQNISSAVLIYYYMTVITKEEFWTESMLHLCQFEPVTAVQTICHTSLLLPVCVREVREVTYPELLTAITLATTLNGYISWVTNIWHRTAATHINTQTHPQTLAVFLVTCLISVIVLVLSTKIHKFQLQSELPIFIFSYHFVRELSSSSSFSQKLIYFHQLPLFVIVFVDATNNDHGTSLHNRHSHTYTM